MKIIGITVGTPLNPEKLGGSVTEEQLAQAVEDYMTEHPISGGGLNITEDGEGNVIVVSTGAVTITDDGNGNVTIV